MSETLKRIEEKHWCTENCGACSPCGILKLARALDMLRNTVGDVRNGFTVADPASWVEQVQAAADEALREVAGEEP